MQKSLRDTTHWSLSYLRRPLRPHLLSFPQAYTWQKDLPAFSVFPSQLRRAKKSRKKKKRSLSRSPRVRTARSSARDPSCLIDPKWFISGVRSPLSLSLILSLSSFLRKGPAISPGAFVSHSPMSWKLSSWNRLSIKMIL